MTEIPTQPEASSTEHAGWTVTVQATIPKDLDYRLHPTAVRTVLKVFEGSGPVVHEGAGRLGVTVGLEAMTAQEAQEAATKIAQRLVETLDLPPSMLVGLRVEDNDTLAQSVPIFPEYVGVGEAASILGVSRQRVHQLASRPGFPEPVLRLKATPVWRQADVRAFAAQRKGSAKRPLSVVKSSDHLADARSAQEA